MVVWGAGSPLVRSAVGRTTEQFVLWRKFDEFACRVPPHDGVYQSITKVWSLISVAKPEAKGFKSKYDPNGIKAALWSIPSGEHVVFEGSLLNLHNVSKPDVDVSLLKL
jgi:hypothetical protein